MPRIGGFFVGPMQSTLNDSGVRVGARIEGMWRQGATTGNNPREYRQPFLHPTVNQAIF